MIDSWRPWALVLAVILAGAWALKPAPPVRWGPGVVVPEQPRQEPSVRSGWSYFGLGIQPLAEFSIRARVLGVKEYSGSTPEDRLSPVDLALGWGNMSDEAVLDRLELSQGHRWYAYRWDSVPPLPHKEIIRSSANMHMVPGSPSVERRLKDIRVGDIVVIQGALIEARNDQGWRWTSSLTRNDTGDGACEVVWVEELRIEPAPVD